MMMMAVLRLFVPTRPTMGRMSSMTRNICRREVIFRARRLTTEASSTITESLANSEGWKDSGPTESHRFDPLYSSPKKSTAVDRSRDKR